jgi:hypothetical protein
MNDTGQLPSIASEAPPEPTPTPIAELIEHWWHDHFPGSPVAQVTTAWNHAFAAKEELKRRLIDLRTGE